MRLTYQQHASLKTDLFYIIGTSLLPKRVISYSYILYLLILFDVDFRTQKQRYSETHFADALRLKKPAMQQATAYLKG